MARVKVDPGVVYFRSSSADVCMGGLDLGPSKHQRPTVDADWCLVAASDPLPYRGWRHLEVLRCVAGAPKRARVPVPRPKLVTVILAAVVGAGPINADLGRSGPLLWHFKKGTAARQLAA